MLLNLLMEIKMGKKPLNAEQVKTLRKLVEDKPLHSLL
tara:strand:- start:503 stop:616 length:114 start_codon:yes stop_codon:yes gene_type:complete